ncbi:MAG: hypothetical protein HQM15_05075 [Deltaproteobacteria bacterium]|nr:hypothetical protein [Deltaproteobacteria bacterium]
MYVTSFLACAWATSHLTQSVSQSAANVNPATDSTPSNNGSSFTLASSDPLTLAAALRPNLSLRNLFLFTATAVGAAVVGSIPPNPRIDPHLATEREARITALYEELHRNNRYGLDLLELATDTVDAMYAYSADRGGGDPVRPDSEAEVIASRAHEAWLARQDARSSWITERHLDRDFEGLPPAAQMRVLDSVFIALRQLYERRAAEYSGATSQTDRHALGMYRSLPSRLDSLRTAYQRQLATDPSASLVSPREQGLGFIDRILGTRPPGKIVVSPNSRAPESLAFLDEILNPEATSPNNPEAASPNNPEGTDHPPSGPEGGGGGGHRGGPTEIRREGVREGVMDTVLRETEHGIGQAGETLREGR